MGMTNTEKILVALAIAALILSAGTLAYVMAVLEGRIAALEEATQPPEQAIVIGSVDKLDTLDPAWQSANWDNFVGHLVHEPLVTWQAHPLEVIPALATEWEWSSDFLSITYDLRRDVKFSNGMPFNATAVKYTYEHSISEAGVGKSFMEPINYDNPVTILDDYTVRINLQRAMPVIYNEKVAIGLGTSLVFPGAVDVDGGLNHGTGPYYVSEWREGEYFTLERNPYYWGDEKPMLDKITVREYKDAVSLRLALEAGEVDMAMNTRWSSSDLTTLLANPNLGSQKQVGGGFMRFIYFDTVRYPPFDNPLVRQAVAYAIDIDRLLTVGWKGGGDPTYSVCQSWLPKYYLPTWEEYYLPNKEKAIQLLEQAGYPDGFTTELWYPSTHYTPLDADVALLIQDDLRQIGITVEIKSEEYASLKARRFDPGMPMAMLGWFTDYPDPDNTVTAFLANYGFYGSITGYNNSRVNELGILAEKEINETKRIEYYHEMQEIGAEEVPVLPFIETTDYAFYGPQVAGFALPALTHAWGNAFMDVYIRRTS